MPQTDFIPKLDDALAVWLHTFNETVQATGSSVGLSPAELAAIAADTEELRGKIDAAYTAKAAMKAATSAKRASRTKVLKAIRRHCARIKTHPDYTSAIGKGYGIVTSAGHWDASHAKPELKLKLSGGKVVVGYKKGGSHGVQIWCKRGAEEHFSLLATDMRPPYYDNRANLAAGPEERNYYAIYIDGNDVVVGQRSNTSVIIV